MATFVIYSDPSDNYLVVEGTDWDQVLENVNPGSVVFTSVADPTTTVVQAGHWIFGGNVYQVFQPFLSFDTSILPTYPGVLSATLSMTVWLEPTVDYTLEARLHAWGATIGAEDYVKASQRTGKTLLATLDTSTATGGTGAVPIAFASTTDFAGALDTTAPTKIVLTSNRFQSSTPPTASSERMQLYSADQTGTANDPVLSVVTLPSLANTLGTTQTKTSGTTTAVTTTKAVLAGETIVVALAMDPAAGTVSASDSAGNSYTVQEQVTNGSGTSGARLVILAKHDATALPSGGTITVTHPSAAARAVSAASFGFEDPSVKVTSATATGASATPSVTVKTPLLRPLAVGAVAIEGPASDTYTADTEFSPLPSTGTDSAGATSNITIRWAWWAPLEQVEYTHNPTLGTSRTWAQAIVIFDTTAARLRTFREKEGLRTSNVPGADVVDAGITYNPATGFASELRMSIAHPTLHVWYQMVIGGTTYGGDMSDGETVIALPADTVGVVIDANADVSYTGITGDLDLRVPA